jgi:hypothetical protein
VACIKLMLTIVNVCQCLLMALAAVAAGFQVFQASSPYAASADSYLKNSVSTSKPITLRLARLNSTPIQTCGRWYQKSILAYKPWCRESMRLLTAGLASANLALLP